MPDISKFKTPLKKLYLKATFTDHYHYDERRKVERAIAVIEQYNNAKFTPQLKKIADEYAIEVLGGKEYAPWLYVYSLIYGKFVEGWIPDNFYGKHLFGVLNKDLYVTAEFKSFSNIIFETPLLPDVGYYIDGILYDREFQAINIEAFKHKVSDYANVFVKTDYSTRGTGVVKLATQDIHMEFFQALDSSCVIQAPIQQHAFFNEFMPESVATLRIPTVKDQQGNITVRGPHLRFGRFGSTWILADNQISIPILNNQGDLGEFGYTGDWRKWTAHPDTQVAFAGKRIPYFEQIIRDCVAMHGRIPHMTYIGWDVIVDNQGQTKMIEWNAGHPGIKFLQATMGPVFKDLNWERFRK